MADPGVSTSSWFRVRHEELLGYEPGERPGVEELSMRDAFFAELSFPAFLAGFGVASSTTASVRLLYVP
jgi:hypothetical protein